MKLILFIAISTFSTGFSLIQELTLYDELNNEGNSVTFTGKYPDLSAWSFFLQNSKSYCVLGWFHFYDELNYEISQTNWGSSINTRRTCSNKTDFGGYKSGRIIGPPDTSIPTLGIYKGTLNYPKGGEEILITGVAANNFPFEPTQVNIFGSSWTLFTENDFGGNSWCFARSTNGYGILEVNGTHPVRSVIRGCGDLDLEYYRNRNGLWQ